MYVNISWLKCVGYLNRIFSTSGLRQGGLLSPLLFNLHVEEIAQILDDTCSVEVIYLCVFPLKRIINQFELPCAKSLTLFHSLISPIAIYNAEKLVHHQIKSAKENKTAILRYFTNSYLNNKQQKVL